MSHHIVLSHSPVERYSGCSCTKATVNDAAVNMGIYTSLWENDLISLDYISRSGIMDHITVFFEISWGTSTVFFHGSCTDIHPYQQSISTCFSPLPQQVLSFLTFLVLAIQTCTKWYLLCFWSAFPLIISHAEHLVIVLNIYMSYLWENVYSLKM